MSTNEQTLDLQKDALLGAGCERIFTDTASGAKAQCVGVDEALSFMRTGDTLSLSSSSSLDVSPFCWSVTNLHSPSRRAWPLPWLTGTSTEPSSRYPISAISAVRTLRSKGTQLGAEGGGGAVQQLLDGTLRTADLESDLDQAQVAQVTQLHYLSLRALEGQDGLA